jgi:hypothetical protein
LNKEDIKAAAKETATLSLAEIPGVPMEVGAASKSVGHYQDINVAAKEGATLSMAEIGGVLMEVGAASKSAVQNFPVHHHYSINSGNFARQISMQLLLPSKHHSASESAAPSLAAAFIS